MQTAMYTPSSDKSYKQLTTLNTSNNHTSQLKSCLRNEWIPHILGLSLHVLTLLLNKSNSQCLTEAFHLRITAKVHFESTRLKVSFRFAE